MSIKGKAEQSVSLPLYIGQKPAPSQGCEEAKDAADAVAYGGGLNKVLWRDKIIEDIKEILTQRRLTDCKEQGKDDDKPPAGGGGQNGGEKRCCGDVQAGFNAPGV